MEARPGEGIHHGFVSVLVFPFDKAGEMSLLLRQKGRLPPGGHPDQGRVDLGRRPEGLGGDYPDDVDVGTVVRSTNQR